MIARIVQESKSSRRTSATLSDIGGGLQTLHARCAEQLQVTDDASGLATKPSISALTLTATS